MGLVANLSCTLCKRLQLIPPIGSEVHHRRSGTGGGRRASDFDTMALCAPHHRTGEGAIHALGTKAFEARYGVAESDLIDDTRTEIGITQEMILRCKQRERDRATAAARSRHEKLLDPGRKSKASPEQKKARPSRPLQPAGAPKQKIQGRPLSSGSTLAPGSPRSKPKIQGRGFSKQAGKTEWPSRKIASRPFAR